MLFSFSFFSFAARGISNGEGRQGWAPPTRLENFMWTDTWGVGGAYCWRGSSGFYSTSSLRPPPPPPNAHTVSLYSLHSLSCNSRNICAQVCWHVHGSTGRVRDTRCTAKNTINPSSPFLFSLFFFCFHLSSAAPCLLFSTHCTAFLPSTPIWEPSVTRLTDLGSVFSKFSFPRCHFLPGSLFHLCF